MLKSRREVGSYLGFVYVAGQGRTFLNWPILTVGAMKLTFLKLWLIVLNFPSMRDAVSELLEHCCVDHSSICNIGAGSLGDRFLLVKLFIISFCLPQNILNIFPLCMYTVIELPT